MHLLFFLFTLDPNLPSQVSTTCPNGYSEYYNRCFKFIKLSFNRKSAEVHCSIDGGRLASITGFFEHEHLRILAKANLVDGFWIGLQSTNSTKSFVWDDSSPYIFTKWAPNEPSMKQQENCVMQSNGSWYDVSCDVTLPSLCEINRGWYWIGGINLDYKRWLYNQPSSSLFDNMNQCAEMTFTGFWDDVSCSKKNRFICKRVVQESTTSPTTMSNEVTTETTEVPYTTKDIKKPISARQSQTLKDEGFPLGGIVGITVIIILVCVLGIISAYFISKRIREKKDGMSRVTGFENAIYKRASTTETEKFAEFS
ncbi:hypothetical protein FSP39_005458 [Pinctada imbricata]|uniref:C-type lectin domain-containing protein n=1 Tax=Pinctada imbricata TaxID=66713 RepID=A0AA88XHS9_PINIB|nr:hypothetical protein FSP39_005458 [Pinctada imbricata]